MMKSRSVSLTITEKCNLSCIYCYEHNKSARTMPESVAKAIIDREIQTYGSEYELNFDLFGGEPFLEFKLLKDIANYIQEKIGNTPYTIFTTTNGTLVHGDIQKWLSDHKDFFYCGLSLDGTKEMQDINRSGSYDMIDLDFFRKTYPEQGVKMTISDKTLPCCSEGIIALHKMGFPVSCNLAYGIDWNNGSSVEDLTRELNNLIEYYLEYPSVEPCSMLNSNIAPVGRTPDKAIRFCGSGIEMVSYDVDGKEYPCQFFMPLSIGVEKAEQAKNIAFPESEIIDSLLDEKCRECVVKSICPNCYGSNYAESGNIYRRSDSRCKLTKIMLKATSMLKAKRWQNGTLDIPEEDISSTLKAIVKIQEELNI